MTIGRDITLETYKVKIMPQAKRKYLGNHRERKGLFRTKEDYKKTKSLTVPDLAMSPTEALARFRRGDDLDQVIGYYETEVYGEAYDEMAVPDLEKMSKLDRLHYINELQEKNEKSLATLKQKVNRARKLQEIEDRIEKEPEKAKTKTEQDGSNKGDNKNP